MYQEFIYKIPTAFILQNVKSPFKKCLFHKKKLKISIKDLLATINLKIEQEKNVNTELRMMSNRMNVF